MLNIQSVTKIFGETVALEKIDLVLQPRMTHVFLGSSGSGKSTLLRLILGIISCDSGQIDIEGRSVSLMSQAERAQNIGYMPQDAGLFPHFTAEENISIVARTMLWDKKRIAQRMELLREVVGLDSALLHRYPKEMSGGQRQRVALIRALFLDPQLVLMDEPFAALDPLIRADIQTEVKALFKLLSKTIVFVTHDVGEAAYLGDNFVMFHKGVVVQQGTLIELEEAPVSSFVPQFLHSQRTFIPKALR